MSKNAKNNVVADYFKSLPKQPHPPNLPVPFWVFITPEIGEWIMQRNVKNRNLSEASMNGFAMDMTAGNWIATHQGIAFDEEGNLIDGQHRIAAIIRSGVGVWLLVSYGWPVKPEKKLMAQMDAVDRGKPRSIADLLTLQHETPQAGLTAAACNTIGLLCSYSNARKATVPQVLGIIEQFKPGLEFAMDEMSELKPLRKAGVIAALAFAFAPYPNEVRAARTKLISGAGMQANDPILALRNFLMSDDATLIMAGGRAAVLGISQMCLHALFLSIVGQTGKLEINHTSTQHFRDLQEKQVAAVRALVSLPDLPKNENKPGVKGFQPKAGAKGYTAIENTIRRARQANPEEKNRQIFNALPPIQKTEPEPTRKKGRPPKPKPEPKLPDDLGKPSEKEKAYQQLRGEIHVPRDWEDDNQIYK